MLTNQTRTMCMPLTCVWAVWKRRFKKDKFAEIDHFGIGRLPFLWEVWRRNRLLMTLPSVIKFGSDCSKSWPWPHATMLGTFSSGTRITLCCLSLKTWIIRIHRNFTSLKHVGLSWRQHFVKIIKTELELKKVDESDQTKRLLRWKKRGASVKC